MTRYEGLFILDPDLGPDATKAAVQGLGEAVTKLGGQVSETSEWGRRKLAYSIGRHRDGHYVLVHFSLGGEALARLDGQLRLNGQVLKFLITRYEEPAANPPVSEPAHASETR
jgi:small subunit ribosomal protein S6